MHGWQRGPQKSTSTTACAISERNVSGVASTAIRRLQQDRRPIPKLSHKPEEEASLRNQHRGRQLATLQAAECVRQPGNCRSDVTLRGREAGQTVLTRKRRYRLTRQLTTQDRECSDHAVVALWHVA